MDQGVAILVTAVAAVISILISGTFNRRLMRKQHTYRVLERMNPWKRFDRAVSEASKLIKAGRIPDIDCAADEPQCDNLDFILNHYEFISAAIVCGDIDEALVKKVEDGRMRRVYLKFLPYIEQNRAARGDLEMWENLEFLVYRWEVQRKDPLDDMLSWVVGRPFIGSFQSIRPVVAASLGELARKTS